MSPSPAQLVPLIVVSQHGPFSCAVLDASVSDQLRHTQLRTLLDIRHNGKVWINECIIDTGAFVSVFPHSTWSGFQQAVHWLSKLNDPRLPPWLRRIAGAFGGSVDFRLGRIRGRFVAFSRSKDIVTSRWQSITGLFAEPHKHFNHRPPVIGLEGGSFATNRLIVEAGLQEARLEEI